MRKEESLPLAAVLSRRKNNLRPPEKLGKERGAKENEK